MENKNYIKNSLLSFTEKNDCTVRALAQTFTKDYELAHDVCKQYGRTNGKGMRTIDLIYTMLPALGFEPMTNEELINPGNTRKGRYTAASFIKDFVDKESDYNYYIITNCHAIGVTTEGISDSSNFSGRARIKWAFKIKK